MQRACWSALILCGIGLVGCAPHTMRLPPDFVPFDKEEFGTHHLRAVSADGVVLGLKSEMNLKEATLDFWADGLKNELAESRRRREDMVEFLAAYHEEQNDQPEPLDGDETQVL